MFSSRKSKKYHKDVVDGYSAMEVDYENEHDDDGLLYQIKSICFRYLEDRKYSRVFEMEELLALADFMEKKYNDVYKFKESLGVKTSHIQFVAVAHSIDAMLINESLESRSTELNMDILKRDINRLLDTLRFCHGILDIMMDDLHEEKFNDEYDDLYDTIMEEDTWDYEVQNVDGVNEEDYEDYAQYELFSEDDLDDFRK
jgi:hypothetical protein